MSKKRKNSNYAYNPNGKVSDEPKNRFFKIFVSAFLSLVLVLGAVLALIVAFANKGAVVEYEGISINEESANYICSYYKYRYMSSLSSAGVSVADSEEFWNTAAEGEKTYGDLLRENAGEYLKQLLCAVYLYDTYATFSSKDKERVNKACDEVLTYKADGSEKVFNSLSEKFGFDYDAFKEANVLIYKSNMAKEIIYGTNGENMKNFPDVCNHYLNSQYSHVHLIFIRTENTFVIDENGNRVVGEDGFDEVRPLTDEEKAKRQEAISYLDKMILNKENDADIQISPELFANYQSKYDEGDSTKYADGYYFGKNSDYAKEFSAAYRQVVEAALNMSVGDYKKVSTDVGVCYIYKDFIESGAYATANSDFFTDFYKDGANFVFSESLVTLSQNAKTTERFDKIDFALLPYNSDLVAYYE